MSTPLMSDLEGTSPPPYTIQHRPWRPWVMVYDADGFPDALMNDYLHYVAWPDHPPRRCYHEARELTQAATWLGFHGYTWRQADAGMWAAYCQDLTGGAPPDTRAISAAHRAIATLHRAYAFWHWHQRLPWQPFPIAAADRQAWVRWAIGENG